MTDWKSEHDAELMLRREWSTRAQKAEAENVSLRAERDHWKQVAESHSASIDDHCREIERLRAALKPFADYGAQIDANQATRLYGDMVGVTLDPNYHTASVKLGDLRRAASAYQQQMNQES